MRGDLNHRRRYGVRLAQVTQPERPRCAHLAGSAVVVVVRGGADGRTNPHVIQISKPHAGANASEMESGMINAEFNKRDL